MNDEQISVLADQMKKVFAFTRSSYSSPSRFSSGVYTCLPVHFHHAHIFIAICT